MLPLSLPSKAHNRLEMKHLRLLGKWRAAQKAAESYILDGEHAEKSGQGDDAVAYYRLAKWKISQYERLAKRIDRISRKINNKEKN